MAGAVACGASVVCGVAVGAAAGAASYAVAKGGTKQFSVKGMAGSAAVGVVTSVGIGRAATALKGAGRCLAASNRFGTASKLFGNNKFFNPAGIRKFAPGKLNQPGSSVKIGWSNIGKQYVFRVGIGKIAKSNKSRVHIDLFKGGRIRGW